MEEAKLNLFNKIFKKYFKNEYSISGNLYFEDSSINRILIIRLGNNNRNDLYLLKKKLELQKVSILGIILV